VKSQTAARRAWGKFRDRINGAAAPALASKTEEPLMRCYRPLALACLVAVAILVSGVTDLSASAVCESSLPFNIDAGLLEPIALGLLHRSPTFQQQCLRIAATVVLRVRVRVTPRLAGAAGETTIQRYDTGALRADVVLVFGGDYVELLAHEFEHVLEQVDGVRLSEQMPDNRAWLTASGAFETTRALEVGLRARQESDLAAAEADAERRAPPRPRNPFD
jgi:hypothetical protein